MGLREAPLALQVAKRLERLLVAAGHIVGMTRIDDTFVELPMRAKMANAFDTDLTISLHFNAAEERHAEGFEVYTSPGRTRADSFATILFTTLGEFVPGPGRKDLSDGDPDKEAKFYMLTKTWSDAVLVEFGFLSHKETEKKFMLMETPDKLALAVAVAVAKWAQTP